jgi:hypothetical protein
MTPIYRRRLIVNRFNLVMSLATMAFGMLFLFWILWVLFANGFSALSPTLFSQTTPPPGSAGGLANAIYGSVMIVLVATLISTPIGILAGIYPRRVRQGGVDRTRDPVHQRHPALGAVDRDRPFRLHGVRDAGRAFFRMGGLVRARADRDSRGWFARRRTCCTSCRRACAKRPSHWARRCGR